VEGSGLGLVGRTIARLWGKLTKAKSLKFIWGLPLPELLVPVYSEYNSETFLSVKTFLVLFFFCFSWWSGLKVKAKFPLARHEVIGGSRVTYPFILNLGTKWKSVVTFTPRPGYSWQENPVPIEREPGCVSESVWTFWRSERTLASIRFEARSAQPVAWSLCRLRWVRWRNLFYYLNELGAWNG